MKFPLFLAIGALSLSIASACLASSGSRPSKHQNAAAGTVSQAASDDLEHPGEEAPAVKEGAAAAAPSPTPGGHAAEEQGPAAEETGHLGEEFDVGLGTETTAEKALTLDLDHCIAMALERNQRLRGAGYDVEAAKGQLSEASATGWPVLEYNYRVAPVPTDVNNAFNDFFNGQVTLFNSIRLTVGVPLVTFGQLGAARNLAAGGLNAARINQGKTRANVVYQVKQLYYGIQLAQETIKLLADAVEKISDKVSSAQAKPTSGMDPYDLLQLKGFQIDMERRLDEARQNLELAYEGLRIQLNLEPGTPIELDSDNLRPQLAVLDKEEQFIDAGMAQQAEVKLLDIGVEAKRQQYRLEKFKLLPKMGFGFYMELGRTLGPIQGLKLTDDFNNPFNYSRAGVGLQITGTLDFHGAAGRIKKSRAEYYKSIYDRLIARRGLLLDIRKAYLEAQRAQVNLRRAKKAESMARQMMFVSKVNADLGLADEQRYADALKYVLLTRGVYFKAIYDYNMALADLEQRIGEASYHEIVPVPDIEEYDAFGDNEDTEGNEGFITIEEGKGNAGSNGKTKPQQP